ncbi:MAG: hypothetical protein ACXWBQ_06670 [Usitatibacter sp.]
MRPFTFLLRLVLCAMLSTAASAESLYAVSMRTYSDPSYKGVEGSLYVVATETGVTQLVAALTLSGGTPVGLDGLAVHPKTHAFYGITPGSSAVIPHTLVKVDAKSGVVTPIGDLGLVGTDIDFDKDGTLYVWIPDTRQFGTVDLATGKATPKGAHLQQGAMKGGIALIGNGRALIAGSGGNGTLDTVDLATGVVTQGPTLDGAPFPNLINGLTYSPNGVLYAVNTNGAHPPLANLVRIDASTGKVANIGPLPNETDALSFGPDLVEPRGMGTIVQEWRFGILVALAVLAVVVVVVGLRLSKH